MPEPNRGGSAADLYQTDLTRAQQGLLARIVARHAPALTDADRAALTLALDKFASSVIFAGYIHGWANSAVPMVARGKLRGNRKE